MARTEGILAWVGREGVVEVEKIVLAATGLAEPPAHPFAIEEHHCLRMAAKRREDFVTGRNCARRSLARHGVAPCPIPVGPGREPLWPEGIVGSITHCQGFYAAATAWKRWYRSIGIDAEPNDALPRDVLPLVLTEKERVDCRRRASSSFHLCRILFSAKESIFKTLYPLLRQFVDFLDVEVAVDDTGSFMAMLPRDLAEGVGAETVRGEVFLTESHIFTLSFLDWRSAYDQSV